MHIYIYMYNIRMFIHISISMYVSMFTYMYMYIYVLYSCIERLEGIILDLQIFQIRDSCASGGLDFWQTVAAG